MAIRPKAVVLEDGKTSLMYLSVLLNRMNLEVLPVTDSADAIEISQLTRPSLITLYMSANTDGLEVLHTIRDDKDLADIPVIMFSSYQNKSKHWEALSLGCVDVLDRPVDLRQLHKAIQRCNLYSGGRRRYLRASFLETVRLHHQGNDYTTRSVTLSERGIFLCIQEQFAKGSRVEIELPLPSGEKMQVGGTVIYGKSRNGGGDAASEGMAIKFDRLTAVNLQILSELVANLLIGDIVTEQTELIFKPH